MTAIPDEITKLDNGTFVGWARTGKQFKVFVTAGHRPVAAVCRFFRTSFDPKSSHFYTANAQEYTVVLANPDWRFEGAVFFVLVPTATARARPARSRSFVSTTMARARRPTTASPPTWPPATR